MLDTRPRLGSDTQREAVIRVRGLEVGFGERTIMKDLDLDVYRGEILGFVGASGTGKSVLTRAILGLVPKRAGTIEVFGENVDALSPASRKAIERRWGVLFQHGALFSSLTVQAEHPGADAGVPAPFASGCSTSWRCSRSRWSASSPTRPTSCPPSCRAA